MSDDNNSFTANLCISLSLISMGRYYSWWTISPRGYRPSSRYGS